MNLKVNTLFTFALLFSIAFVACKKENNTVVLDPLKGTFWIKSDTGLVEIIPTKAPVFLKGGKDGLLYELAVNVKYPADARNNNIQGVCKVRFEITETGRVENYEVLQDPGGGIGEESLRALKVIFAGTPFSPAMLNNKPIRVVYVMPISFKIE